MAQRIEYQAPDKATIRRYAGAVAGRLAGERDDESFQEAEAVQGLTGFLEVAASIQAKRLSAESGAVDNGQE